MQKRKWGQSPNPIYLAFRLMRRWVPVEWTYRLASKDQWAPLALLKESRLYSDLLSQLQISPLGTTVLEIGPGTWNPLSLLLLKKGAQKVVLCEPFPRDFSPSKLRERLAPLWESMEPMNGPSLDHAFCGEDLNPDTVSWIPSFAESLPVENDSVDLIVSNCVLQFIPNMQRAFEEMHRVLRPGGSIMHIVDLRDHFFRYPFEMLTFSESFWNWLCPLRQGRGWHNRLRVSEYLQELKATQFANFAYIALQRDPMGYKKVEPYLNQRFTSMSRDELDITMAVIHARKP